MSQKLEIGTETNRSRANPQVRFVALPEPASEGSWYNLFCLQALHQLREIVFADRALQEQLDSVTDPAIFAALASEIAANRGIELSAAEILATVSTAWQRWLMRSLP